MTKAEALFGFWASFSLPAYEENSVPSGDDAPSFPYITYELSDADFGNEVALTGMLWYRDRSGYSALKEAVLKSYEISSTIGRGGTIIDCDGGAIWIKRGSPFSNVISDQNDGAIKGIVINITVDFMTEN